MSAAKKRGQAHRYVPGTAPERGSFTGIWYHGDAARRSGFSDQRMDRPRDQDQNAMGPGIYWTRDLEQARGYAFPKGYVYAARMNTTRSRVIGESTPPQRGKVLALLAQATPENREAGLSDWDENPVRARENLIRACLANERMLDAMLEVYRGFFTTPEEYAAAVVQAGFDAFVHELPEVDHLIVWNPSIIDVVSEEVRL